MSSMRVRPVQATSPWWNPSRWDPWRDFEVLRRQVEQLCERPPQAVGSRDEYSPTVDICDAGGEFTVRVDLPGVRDEDVDVTLDGNVLSVRGSRRPDAGEAALLFGERRTGRFARTVALPAEIRLNRFGQRWRGASSRSSFQSVPAKVVRKSPSPWWETRGVERGRQHAPTRRRTGDVEIRRGLRVGPTRRPKQCLKGGADREHTHAM